MFVKFRVSREDDSSTKMKNYQLSRTRLEEDGQCICNTSHTIYKADQNDIVIEKRRSGVSEEVEHGEINQWLDKCIETVYCIFGKKTSQATHP